MATVNSLVDAAITEGADLLITLSTPTLQAALKRPQETIALPSGQRGGGGSGSER